MAGIVFVNRGYSQMQVVEVTINNLESISEYCKPQLYLSLVFEQ